ncbi:MAG: SDR family NAD(P)-dependent oxidoreductase [Bacteriovoracaceae bacterium]|jgi:short-subunit dehydrogenase|nr:SDR family NAD(P)-dependent oxidoreductase [Bacteriovoracaceae bacterium]
MQIKKGQVWLVTGAASGIGRLMSLELAKRGALVALLDVNREGLLLVEKEIREANGTAHGFFADLSKVDSFLELKQEIHSRLGKISGLINNAGVVFGGEFEKTSLEKHQLTYLINTMGPVALTHVFMNDLLSGQDAHIVNIASASGFVALPYGSTYASSKWAMIGFSDSLRLEMLERGLKQVRVTTVCPSYIATGMFQGVKPPLMIPWLKPEVIVSKIFSGIESDLAFIKEPFLVKTIDLLKGLLPLGLYDSISKLLGVTTSMFHWKGRS